MSAMSLQPTDLPTTPGSSSTESHKRANKIVVFSGGSAANSIVDVFGAVAEEQDCKLHYVIPISDNGGSSSELIRVFGGPGIGDLRSRLVRLIPKEKDNHSDIEARAIKSLFSHRLPPSCRAAREEWLDIVESTHVLWQNISTPKKELIRSFFNVINLEIVKRLRPSSRFDFTNASVGNLFLTGARLFTGSLESAIYLLSSVCSVSSNVSVLPAINTNFANHISVGLENGQVITGQNNISHPSESTSLRHIESSLADQHAQDLDEQDRVEDANPPGTLPSLRKNAIIFTKSPEVVGQDDLPARIARLWYINPYGQEIRMPANSRVVDALREASTIVYSIGSLFTSIIPSLVLKNIGQVIANPNIKSKILILNGTIDRETGPSHDPFTAMDFVAAIVKACADSQGCPTPSILDYAQYVTHVVYIEGPKSPMVTKADFETAGIALHKLSGRNVNGELRYDEELLKGALDLIIGRRFALASKSRRNTLVS